MPWFDLFVKAADPGALARARELAAQQRAALAEKKRRDALAAQAAGTNAGRGTNPDKSIARKPIGVRPITGYDIAYGYLESGDGEQPIYAYSGNGLANVRLDVEIPPLPAESSYENIFYTGTGDPVGFTHYGFVTNFQSATYALIVFPAGGTNLIVSIQNTFHRSKLTANYAWDGVYPFTNPNPGMYGVNYTDSWTDVETEVIDASFVIGYEAVRQIETPTAVSEIMRRTVTGTPQWFTVNATPTEIGGYDVTVPEPDGGYFPDSGFALDYYGMVFDAADRWATPAVFTVYSDSRSALTDPLSYVEARAILTANGAPYPAEYLESCRLEGTCSTDRTTINADVSRTTPPSYQETDGMLFELNRKPAITTVIPEATEPAVIQSLAAWDWGNPGYCKERLITLGFPETDLAP
jgi:hypothetical protein